MVAASASAILVLALVLVSSAHAVSPAAEASFQEGRRLMAAGNTAEACTRFAESYALEASSGTLLNLALCHETEGQTATAWGEYRAAARLARAQGKEDRATTADTKATALESRLSRLTVVAATSLPGLQVARDDGSLGGHDLDLAVPVDPGVHRVRASAPGRRAWTTTLEIKEGEQRTLEIPTLEEQPKPTSEVTHGESPIALVGPDPAPPSHRSSFDLYVAGGGGILVVAGTVVYGIAYAKLESAISTCNHGPGCSAADRDGRVFTIDTLKYVGIGSWIAGGALLAASGLHYRFRNAKTPLTVAIDPWNEAFAIQAVF